ncbi:MAG TPA: pilus assembly protein PilE [Pseudomonas sp.]|uniref:type IV pilin protein n=1 Tax=Stutzerimonas balearica TaxID=74829 RepID=UPI000C63D972|nr:type IV pilin protein [Stutzerimonas balearica]MBB61878.1 pilus assembly protein PilE [Pseudomonas sp.]HAF91588.1 pilus assembly protein PilE [Pseudomonas sp.]|tara:strand:- start:1057 stop:1494 length:438 start_codon:yes stop_codon:yes gene_type:complete
MMITQRALMKGFTLLEVMIVVAIIGILAAIAYPSYDEYVKRGNRAEGTAQLNDIAARQERYYAQTHTYVTTSTDLSKLGLKVDSGKVATATGKYAITVAKVNDDGGYTLTATQNFGDTKCGNLILNALGAKDRSGSGKSVNDCWR